MVRARVYTLPWERTGVQVGQVRVLDVRVVLLQVVAELGGRVGCRLTLGAVVHLHTLVFPRVQDVLADVLGAVGPGGDTETHRDSFQKIALYIYIYIYINIITTSTGERRDFEV